MLTRMSLASSKPSIREPTLLEDFHCGTRRQRRLPREATCRASGAGPYAPPAFQRRSRSGPLCWDRLRKSQAWRSGKRRIRTAEIMGNQRFSQASRRSRSLGSPAGAGKVPSRSPETARRRCHPSEPEPSQLGGDSGLRGAEKERQYATRLLSNGACHGDSCHLRSLRGELLGVKGTHERDCPGPVHRRNSRRFEKSKRQHEPYFWSRDTDRVLGHWPFLAREHASGS